MKKAILLLLIVYFFHSPHFPFQTNQFLFWIFFFFHPVIDPKDASKDDAQKLADNIQDAKDHINNFNRKLDGEAKKQADLAKELAEELPKALDQAADDLAKAGDKVVKNDKDPKNKEDLDKEKEKVADLLDVARSLLPSSGLSPDVQSIAQALKKDEHQVFFFCFFLFSFLLYFISS